MTRALFALAALVSLATPSMAQVVSTSGNKAPSLSTLPKLPAMTADSPRTSLLFADRFESAQTNFGAAFVGGSASPVKHTIDTALTGTGFVEPIEYQLPDDYSSSPSFRPLVVAYHGFGASAASVSSQSTIDEECNARGWLYLSVTGLDDKLFGSEICQQHIETAIAWMINQFRVDEERIYMVGFSMGAGVVSNFASRHRESDGLMVAAVGLVSGSYDWVLTHAIDAGVQPWLEHPLNFGGTPATELLSYRSAGGLSFQQGTYPPFPGTHDETFALAAVNLADIPSYITWDTGDTLVELPSQSTTLVDELNSRGGTLVAAPTSGTVDGSGKPATHSWAVLDEAAMCDFFDGRVVDRAPRSIWTLVAEPRSVAWLDVHPHDDAFALVHAVSDIANDRVTLSDNQGAQRIYVDTDQVGLSFPARLIADNAGSEPSFALLRGEISRVTNSANGSDVALPEYDGTGDGTGAIIPPAGTVDITALAGSWGASLAITPDPTLPGGVIELRLTTDPVDPAAVLIIGLVDEYLTFPNGTHLNVSLGPPSVFLPLPLNGSGTLAFPGNMPAGEPSVSGFRFLMQALVLDADAPGATSSNPVALDVD